MIKFTKFTLVAAAFVAAPMAFAQTMQASGVAGTGVDFVGGITPVSSNPGVAGPSGGGDGGTGGGSPIGGGTYGDYGAVRGVFALDTRGAGRSGTGGNQNDNRE